MQNLQWWVLRFARILARAFIPVAWEVVENLFCVGLNIKAHWLFSSIDCPLILCIDNSCYLGGARSKEFALLKVAFWCPEVASELVQDISEFFDIFLFLCIILARNIERKRILRKTLKQFGLVASKHERNRDTRAIFSASHVADEFAYVAW